ncbi:WXG100 family type VII secretion target [Microbacterium sp.]|uniref:WXG100 family type VII secretion target n=1 Tax=Microbacterium sp. TaxID=51671 RepID=UPI003A951981
MDGRFIKLNHDRIDSLVQQVRTRVELMDDALDALEDKAATLSGQWNGEAREAFATAHRAWDESMRELTGIANDLARIAGDGNRRFREHDQRDAGVWAV